MLISSSDFLQPIHHDFVWMVHVYYIKSTFYILLGAPPPVLAFFGNILFIFIDSPGIKIDKYLKITLIGVPYFSVGAGLGSVTSHSLNCSKTEVFLSNLDNQFFSARILASLRSVLVHYFSATILLYFSTAF